MSILFLPRDPLNPAHWSFKWSFTGPLSTWSSAQVYLGKAHFSFWFVLEYLTLNPHLMAWIVGLWQQMQKIDWYEELVWLLDGAIWPWTDCLNKTVWQQAEVSGMSIPVWVTPQNSIAPSFVTLSRHNFLCVGLDTTSRVTGGKTSGTVSRFRTNQHKSLSILLRKIKSLFFLFKQNV